MSIRNKMPGLHRLGSVRRRSWAALATAVLLAGGGAWLHLAAGGSSTTTQRITSTIATGTYKTTVSASGTITPKRSAALSFNSSGTVTAVAAAVGDKVAKGDVLARIDDTALVAQRDAAQSQVTAALDQLSQDSASSSSQVSADEASLAAARSQLAQAQDAVANATLRAPFAGTVSAVGYAVGDQAGSSGANQGSGTSTAAITVISPRRLLIKANVSASDVTQLKKGMQAEITPTGGADVAYGVVTAVGVIATASDTGAAQFPVTIDVTGTPTGLYPGSSATVAITVKQAMNVLTVPTQSLHSNGNSTYVYLIVSGERVKTPVVIGSSYGMQTQVTSGVKVGDVVEVLSVTIPKGSGTANNNGPGGSFTFPGGGTGGGNFGGGTFAGGNGPTLGGGQ